MKKWVFVLTMLISSGTYAMPWQELQIEIAKIKRQQAPDPSQIARLVSTVDMAMIYTKALVVQGKDSLYCPAMGSAMQFNEVLEIIADQAKHQQASGDTPVGELLLRGLSHRFPCGSH